MFIAEFAVSSPMFSVSVRSLHLFLLPGPILLRGKEKVVSKASCSLLVLNSWFPKKQDRLNIIHICLPLRRSLLEGTLGHCFCRARKHGGFLKFSPTLYLMVSFLSAARKPRRCSLGRGRQEQKAELLATRIPPILPS